MPLGLTPSFIQRRQFDSYVLDDEVIVFDPVANRTHVLNPPAALIWSLCDGRRTPRMMARVVARAYSIDRRQAWHDTRDLVGQLRDAGLISESSRRGSKDVRG